MSERAKRSNNVIPIDRNTDIELNCETGSAKIVHRFYYGDDPKEESIAYCVERLRRGEGGVVYNDDVNRVIKYYEPIDWDYYSVLSQIESIYDSIEKCKEILRNRSR